jgi:hypothetical protein
VGLYLYKRNEVTRSLGERTTSNANINGFSSIFEPKSGPSDALISKD